MKRLKQLFISLFFLTLSAPAWGAGLELSKGVLFQEADKQVYKTALGADNDEVIIGDEKSADFKPQITFTKWNKENSLTIKAPDIFTSTIPDLVSNKLEIGDSKTGFYFSSDGENFKLGIIWKEKPSNNSWSAILEGIEELDFFYQRPYKNEDSDSSTWEEIGKLKATRKAEISGSYAIYHKTKKNHEIGKTNYGTGKFGHLYRPRFIDATGKWVWGIIQIKDGKLTEICPPDFLDSAIYPVKSNLQFGMNSIGGSAIQLDAILRSGIRFTSAPAGQITKAYVAAKVDSGSRLIRMALYDNSGTDANALIANTDSGSMSLTRTTDPTSDLATWTQADIASGFTLVAGTTYWIVIANNYNTTTLYYDEVVGTKFGYSDAAAYADFPQSNILGSLYFGDSLTWKISTCYEYTTGGAATYFPIWLYLDENE